MFYIFFIYPIYDIYLITFFLLTIRPFPSSHGLEVPGFAIHCYSQCRVMGGNMLLIWIHRVSQTWVQAIVRWPSSVVATCCAIPMLELGQSSVALLWMWHVCVSYSRFWSWLPLCLLLRKARVWERSVDACAVFWWPPVTLTWSIAYPLASPV